MAVLYSEGPSAKDGGEIGLLWAVAELDPAYAAVAFNLKGDRVSNVLKVHLVTILFSLLIKKVKK